MAGYDRTHNFSLGWVYEMPFGPNKPLAKSGPLSLVARDWQINGVFTADTGTPFTVSSSAASLNAPSNGQTADQIKQDVQKLGGIGAEAGFYDPLAFAPVTAVRFGSSGRNILRGPGLITTNLSVFRTFPVRERMKVMFKAEAFNFTNTPHFNNPGTNVSNRRLNSDGSINSLGGFMAITGAVADERQFRFGLRVEF